MSTKTTSRRPGSRRAKFLIAAFAVTAALGGGAQALAPATAGATINSCRHLADIDFWAWVECEQAGNGPGYV